MYALFSAMSFLFISALTFLYFLNVTVDYLQPYKCLDSFSASYSILRTFFLFKMMSILNLESVILFIYFILTTKVIRSVHRYIWRIKSYILKPEKKSDVCSAFSFARYRFCSWWHLVFNSVSVICRKFLNDIFNAKREIKCFLFFLLCNFTSSIWVCLTQNSTNYYFQYS